MQDFPSVFLSYSSKDHEAANAILTSLERAGVRCWIAPRDIQEGEAWEDAIIRGISGCKVVLCMLSSKAVESEQVQKEIHFACEVNKRPVIPVRLENFTPTGTLAYQLGRLQWLDAVSQPIDRHLWKIVDRVQTVIKAVDASRQAGKKEAPEEVPKPDPIQPIKLNPVLIGGANKWLRRALLPGLGLLIVALVAAKWSAYWPKPKLYVSEYHKITENSRANAFAGSDGTKLYFAEPSPPSVDQVAIGGGAITRVPLSVQGQPSFIYDVSQDGSSLLVTTGEEANMNRVLWNASLKGGSPQSFGYAQGAGYSPDGSRIAIITPEGDLEIASADGRDAPRKLQNVGRNAYKPTWSPDGMIIRFERDHSIWEIAADGTNLHKLFRDWPATSTDCAGRWTADGKFYLFTAGESADKSGGQIWALDEGHTGFGKTNPKPVQLTTTPEQWKWPVPTRDGKIIFAVGLLERGELLRFDPQMKGLQPFLDNKSWEGVTFFPKDGRMAYVSFPQGVLFKADMDGSNAMQLTYKPLHPEVPRWSPDGLSIAFMDVAAPKKEIYIVSSEGSSAQRVLPLDDEQELDPTWSKDGDRILYASGVPRDPKTELRIVEYKTGQVTKVPDGIGLFSPRWSPDGKYIAAVVWQQTRLKIYSFEKQTWTTLPAAGGTVLFPTWSNDSKYIYYLHLVGGKRGVFRVSVNGGDPELVVDLKEMPLTGWYNNWMDLDPNNAPMVLRDNGSEDIYALTVGQR